MAEQKTLEERRIENAKLSDEAQQQAAEQRMRNQEAGIGVDSGAHAIGDLASSIKNKLQTKDFREQLPEHDRDLKAAENEARAE